LDALLSKLVAESIDSRVTTGILSWQAALLEGPLADPKRAADIYAKLVQLAPGDARLAARWRNSLRRAGRHQELLLAIKKQLEWTQSKDNKLALLRESAIVWDRGLRNRYEAIEAWEKVLALQSQDEEATRALARLKKKASSGSMEALFNDDESDSDQDVFEEGFPEHTESEEAYGADDHASFGEPGGAALTPSVHKREDSTEEVELEPELLDTEVLVAAPIVSQAVKAPVRSMPPPLPPQRASQPPAATATAKQPSMPPARKTTEAAPSRPPSLPPPLPPRDSAPVPSASRSMPPPVPPKGAPEAQNGAGRPQSMPPPIPPKEPSI